MWGFVDKNDPFRDHDRRNRARRGRSVRGKLGDELSAQSRANDVGGAGAREQKWDKKKAIRAILQGPEAWAEYRAAFPVKDFSHLDLRDIDFALEFSAVPKQVFQLAPSFAFYDDDVLEEDDLLEAGGDDKGQKINYTASEVFPFLRNEPSDESEEVQLTTFEDYDFSHVDFSGGKFSGIALLNCRLTNAHFAGTTIYRSYFTAVDNCEDVWFDYASLNSSIFEMRLTQPDFYLTEMRNVDFSGPVHSGSFYWCKFHEAAYFNGISDHAQSDEDDSADAYAIDQNGYATVFFDCSALPEGDAGLRFHGLEGVQFDDCYLPETRFSYKVERVEFSKSDLPGSSFQYAKLSKVGFSFANIRKVDFSDSELKDVSFTKVIYRRRELEGKFQNIHDASGIYGDLISQQDLRDQVFIDSLRVDVTELEKRSEKRLSELRGRRGEENGKRGSRGRNRLTGSSIFNWFSSNFDWASGAVVGVGATIVALMIGHYDGWSWLMALLIAFSALFAAYLNTPNGQRNIVLAVWRQLDYGRDWDRVLVAAFVAVGIFGIVYQFAAPDLLCFANKAGAPDALTCQSSGSEIGPSFGFYPWYVALMGFATLGLVELVEIRSAAGALIVTLNVLAGFITLGLLLAVVSRSFTRRG